MLSVAVAVTALLYTHRANLNQQRTQEDANNAQLYRTEQGQLTDLFTRAVEQIGSEKLDVRLGAIYALERVMRDSAIDSDGVAEILAAYIRQRVPAHQENPSPEPTKSTASVAVQLPRVPLDVDINAAMVALGRRTIRDGGRLPDFSDLNLANKDMEGIRLYHVNLAEADLSGANLAWATLANSDLRFTRLTNANLLAADLSGSNLRQAALDHAQLVRQ